MKIVRFDISERILHWSHAIFFIWLLISGIHIFLTPKSLLGDPLIKMMHLYASIPFIMILPVVYHFGSSYMHEDLRELMFLKTNEIHWFSRILANPKINSSKFNPGQKVNFFVTLLLITGLSFSGSVIWLKSRFSVDFVELNFMLHDFFAELSLLLFSGHILFSLYHSESIRGIVSGKVDEKWGKEHYSEWWKKGG
jgi:formate dehydrogenase subunit gamma